MIPVFTEDAEVAQARAAGAWRKIKTLTLPITYAEDCDDADLSDRAFRLHITATFRTSMYGMREPIDESGVRRCISGSELERAVAVRELVIAGMWEELREGVWLIMHDLPAQRDPQPWDDPNGPGRSWEGTSPLGRTEPAPAPGVSVVYHLFDEDGLCYIGSTLDLRTRLDAHRYDGKHFTEWTARKCPTRQAAFTQEWTEIAEHRPRLNRIQPSHQSSA